MEDKRNSVLVWFRNDLRIEDNPALLEASKLGLPVIPLFVHDQDSLWSCNGAARIYLHYSLQALKLQLEKLGSKLIIRSTSKKKNTQNILEQVIKENNVSHIYWNRNYEPESIKRDTKIKSSLNKQGLSVESFPGNLLIEPWEIFNKQDKPFKVFTPFWKTLQKIYPIDAQPLPKPKKLLGPDSEIKTESIDDLSLIPGFDPKQAKKISKKMSWNYELRESLGIGDKHWSDSIIEIWNLDGLLKDPVKHLKSQVENFCAKSLGLASVSSKGLRYIKSRDLPSANGVSKLSPYLHFGLVSPKMLWAQVVKNFKTVEAIAKQNQDAEMFLRQLAWREFAHSLLYHFPDTVSKPLNTKFEKFEWQEEPELLEMWQQGKTGYPIVDAGMRELWVTGWMHNRVRMIVASFLVKDLLIHWEEGAKWFWDTLLDADLANNTMGWQWVAGCGADAAPYFRIFNPILQGEKFDPDAIYVRKWVPEVANLPNKWIHKPFDAPPEILSQAGVELGQNYPYPVVDHSLARARALDLYSRIKA